MKNVKPKRGMSKEEINQLISNYIELDDNEFMGIRYNHNWKCKCGNIIKSRTWVNIKFKNAIRCDECKYREQEERYKYEVEKSGEYEYIRSFRKGDTLPNGKKVKGSSYIQIKHKYCGRIYEIQSGQFINIGIRCSKCCGSYEKSFAYYIEKELGLNINDVWDFERNTVNPYMISRSSRHKIWVKCVNHIENHPNYKTYPYVFSSGHRCKLCSNSFGEKRIEDYLKENNVLYENQKEYEGLIGVGNGKLSYDFYLPKYNLLIEYQGKQHEKYIKGFHRDKKSFKRQKIHDILKKRYANEHKINLLEIWYYDFDNIEKILNNITRINFND